MEFLDQLQPRLSSVLAGRSIPSFLMSSNHQKSIRGMNEHSQPAGEETGSGRQRRRSWLYLLILFFCIPLYGIDRDRALDQLYHTGWTYIEGAPGQVHALAQTT